MAQDDKGWVNVGLWRWCAQVIQLALADGVIFCVCVGVIAFSHYWLKVVGMDKIQILSWLSINDIVTAFHAANLVVNLSFLLYHIGQAHRAHTP